MAAPAASVAAVTSRRLHRFDEQRAQDLVAACARSSAAPAIAAARARRTARGRRAAPPRRSGSRARSGKYSASISRGRARRCARASAQQHALEFGVVARGDRQLDQRDAARCCRRTTTSTSSASAGRAASGRDRLEPLAELRGALLDQPLRRGGDQVGLGREVVRQRAARDAGPADDVVGGHRAVAEFGQALDRGVEQPGPHRRHALGLRPAGRGRLGRCAVCVDMARS